MAGEVRAQMIDGAVRLLATNGLQATSFSEVLELTGAPRGSIYHHFPRGKEQLVASAVELSGERATETLESWAGLPADRVAANFLGMWRELLTRADYRAGCAVLAVTIATDSPDLLEKTATVFRAWRGQLGRLLAQGGLGETDAARFAATLIAASEGAVVLARAERNIEPFDAVAAHLTDQVTRLLS